MSEGPKLYTNKPKKAQLRQFQEQHKGKDFTSPPSSSSSSSSASAAAATYTMGSQQTPPPPQPPKESFARRYKFLWPLLLTVNLAVGAYLFMRTKKKDATTVEEETPPASTTAVTTAPIIDKPPKTPSVLEPVKLREPIPQDQQQELFKWILEEKRKVKPKDPQEKQRLDEEKAILKQFIRAKSIPTF